MEKWADATERKAGRRNAADFIMYKYGERFARWRSRRSWVSLRNLENRSWLMYVDVGSRWSRRVAGMLELHAAAAEASKCSMK
jgi:hypothetical protein